MLLSLRIKIVLLILKAKIRLKNTIEKKFKYFLKHYVFEAMDPK